MGQERCWRNSSNWLDAKDNVKEMKTSALGCCGLNCGSCPVFIATSNNDEEMKQKVADEWSKLYSEYVSNGLKMQDINCGGCKSEENVFVGCLNCPIRRCCGEKRYENCADCEKYETCDLLNGFYSMPSHQSAKNNLAKMRTNAQPF